MYKKFKWREMDTKAALIANFGGHTYLRAVYTTQRTLTDEGSITVSMYGWSPVSLVWIQKFQHTRDCFPLQNNEDI